MPLTLSDSSPISLTRVETNEAPFIARCADHTDGVVINLRFDTPPKHETLKRAALRARLQFLIDLESWRLPYLKGPEDKSFGSDAQTVLAKAASLPLDPTFFSDPGLADGFLRAAITAQVGASLSFAPDFQFRSLEDPWFGVNLQCIKRMRTLAPRMPIAAWVHVTLETMLSGVLPFVAERYARELPIGTSLALTVSDMNLERSPEEIATYLSAGEAFAAHGLRVLCDRSGEVAIAAACAGFASGVMIGNRIYRSAPPSPKYDSPYNPAIRLAYFDGARARRVRRETARRRGENGKLGCRVSGDACKAIEAQDDENIELRLHAAHEMRESLRRAHALGARKLGSQWREADQKHLRGLAQALELAEARSQEA